MNFLKRGKARVKRYIEECKASFAPLADDDPAVQDSLEKYMEEADQDRMKRANDPRFNIYAPMPPDEDRFKNLGRLRQHLTILAWVRTEYFNGWREIMDPKGYREKHRVIVADYEKRLEERERRIHPEKFIQVDVVNSSKVDKEERKKQDQEAEIISSAEQKKLMEMAQLGRETFLSFLKGYEEGKSEEEKKGPLHVDFKI